VMEDGSAWEPSDHFPNKTEPTLSVLSADQTMVYTAERDREELYAETVGEGVKFMLGMAHTLPNVFPRGVLDMAVNEVDRIFALTPIGVQVFRSYGLVDVILDLPAENPLLIAYGEGDEADVLFVKTENGCWKRKLLGKGRGTKPTMHRHRGYYDG